ncbi:branched-chain amino acid ABC transporter permease [Zwartia panacis]|uniref:branched-chain amino acid ABC transporter permease n=1 Tax=Zwartia panacis TaxID=2683345 RepID=UPI0025B3988A|nr:branched-chain amino acid ABC transporter permease [Zwartia panacis]MDN4016418.1 branched-chain amino acid ABC transporter permease [Zwartia panacis]
MQYFFQQLLNGITSGAVYASLGLALVLIYRTTNIANFAQGEMATFSAFLSWQITQFGVPIAWSILLVMIISILIGAVVYAVIVRPVQHKDEMTIIIVTLGLFLAFNSATGAIWGFMQKSSPSPFPTTSWTLGSLRISAELLSFVGVLIAVSGGLYLLFQKTRLGMALRAAASNAQSAQLVGIPYTKMMIFGWGMAAALGAVSGALVASRLTLDPNMMADVIIYAFASAVVGGMSSYVGAVVGGIVVGVSQAFSTAFLPGLGADLQIIVPLLLIVTVLIIKPEGLFGKTVAARV